MQPLRFLAASTSRAPAPSTAPLPLLLRRTFCSCRPSLVSVPRSARKKPANTTLPILKQGRVVGDTAPQSELFAQLAEAKVPAVRNRPSLANADAARELVRQWGVDQMEDVVVVDTWAGAGGLSRAFLELPNVKKVIAVEDAHRYTPMLAILKERHGDRFEHVISEPFLWESYSLAEKKFENLVPKKPFDDEMPNLFVSAQIPNNTYGRLMCIQMITAIAGEMWYYQYGRVQIGMLGSSALWNKLRAQPGDPGHHKLAVLAPSLAELETMPTMHDYRPAEKYFHKPRGDPGLYSSIKVVPREKPLVQNFDALEFLTRNMFVTRANLWHKALAGAAPGANNLVHKAAALGLTDMKKTVQMLTLDDWVILTKVFDEWAFRPTTLFDDFSFAEDRI